MATYTQAQLTAYFNRIKYSPPQHDAATTPDISSPSPSPPSSPPDPLALLTALQKHHMAYIPFTSLTLHYSKHRQISLDPSDLFSKIVDNRRGGYCMEVNTFFGAILRSLGFTVLSVGGRVKSPVSGYKGWDHMVNLVTINQKRYLVDVGFGADSPPSPIPLEHDHIFALAPPAKGRLRYQSLEEHTDPNQRVWVFASQETPSSEWKDRYSFVEIEFFPMDFEVMNLRTSTTPQSFFVQSVMCITTLLDEEKDKVNGVLILFKDSVKRRFGVVNEDGGEEVGMEVLEEFKTEEDRVGALEKYFGIVLTEGERKGIRGLASELR